MIGEVDVELRSGIPVAFVRGEIDLSNVATVRDRLTDGVPASAPGLVVDLTETRYLDSSGVRMLFEIAELLRVRRQALRLVAGDTGIVRRVLALTRLDDGVPLDATAEAAVVALSGGGR